MDKIVKMILQTQLHGILQSPVKMAVVLIVDVEKMDVGEMQGLKMDMSPTWVQWVHTKTANTVPVPEERHELYQVYPGTLFFSSTAYLYPPGFFKQVTPGLTHI